MIIYLKINKITFKISKNKNINLYKFESNLFNCFLNKNF